MAQYGLNPFAFSTKFKVGRLTGNQAFSTWAMNNNKKMMKQAKKNMWSAAAWCRTDMRRGFSRRVKAQEGRGGYYWRSRNPSKAGSAPRRNEGGKRGLQFVTFTREQDFRFRVGPDMFPSGGYGAQTNFHGDIMHAKGGNGMVNLPEDLDQMDPTTAGLALTKKIPWPMPPKMAHYPKRPYLEKPAKKTAAKFKWLFADLHQDRAQLLK